MRVISDGVILVGNMVGMTSIKLTEGCLSANKVHLGGWLLEIDEIEGKKLLAISNLVFKVKRRGHKD